MSTIYQITTHIENTMVIHMLKYQRKFQNLRISDSFLNKKGKAFPNAFPQLLSTTVTDLLCTNNHMHNYL